MFETIDYVVIGAYVALLIFISVRAARKETPEDYLIGGRNLGTASTMLTLNASKTGSIIMIFVAMLYIWGFAAIWYFVGAALGFLAFIPFALYVKRTSTNDDYTLPQYFTHRYGRAAGLSAATIVLIALFGYLVLNLIAGAKVLSLMSGLPYVTSVGLMMLVVVVYVTVSGYRAVVRTDALQYVAMLGIAALLAFVMFSGATVPASEWSVTTDAATFSGFFLLGLLLPFASADFWQRVHSASDARTLKRAFLLSTGLYIAFALMLALIGLAIKATLPNLDPELALAQGMLTLLPSGLGGLSTVLLFSALMSTIDTSLFTASVTVVQDFMRKTQQAAVTRIKLVGIVIAVLGAASAAALKSLILAAYLFTALSVVLAVPILYTWARKNAPQRSIVSAVAVGSAGVIAYTALTLSGDGVNPLVIIVALLGAILGVGIGELVSLRRG